MSLTRLNAPDGQEDREGLARLEAFLETSSRPDALVDGLCRLLDLKDPLVAPRETFFRRRQGTQFELWDYPVNIFTLLEIDQGRLLSLPPGSRRLSAYRSLIGEIVDAQIAARFPRLLAELANRPNLFFPGVYFPHELQVSNMEMISAHHGTFYVVHAELWTGGRIHTASVVLKPTDMAVESIITFTLQFINRRLDPAVRRKIGPILAPTIVAIDDVYGMMDLMPGKNGVEFLPRGIRTGTLEDLKKNEFPPDLAITREETLQIAREFAKQAAMAYYLRLYDRKPDQLMIHRAADGRLHFSHIDFGRALKRNYALPWKRHYDPSRPALSFDVHQIPYFEAAGAFIYLPHFIPANFRNELSPFDGEMRRVIMETFTLLANQLKSNADDIHSLFKYLIDRRTQYRPNEVNDVSVEPVDVEHVYKSLLTLEDPGEAIDSILNLAYHEREGTAAIHVEGEDDTGGIYRRAMLSGERVTSLRDNPAGSKPYRLADYRKRGRVSYDAEQKTLRIEFGDAPDTVVSHIERKYSRHLAAEIRNYAGDLRGLDLTVSSGGEVVVRVTAGDARVGATRRMQFPPEIMREITEAGSGFAPGAHIMVNAAEFRHQPPRDDYLETETARQALILSNDLQGKEILQFVMAVEPDQSPLGRAMAGAIRSILPNADFLADLDPYEDINLLVVALGRNHLAEQWPTGMSLAEAFLPAGTIGPDGSPMRSILSLYAEVDLSHFVHLILTARFAGELGRRTTLSSREQHLLTAAALLHDLNILDPSFREVLMEPSGRLSRRILTAVLERHADISMSILDEALSRIGGMPPEVDGAELRHILHHHHRESSGPTGRIQQILHLADNIAVFADRTRPDHWIRGFLRLEDIAPRWIDAQLERGQIDREIWQAAHSFFSDPAQYALLRRLDQMSAFYPQCYSTLQMAASLHSGLNPQHPNPMADLRERHGEGLVNRMFDNLMRSGLSIRDKINVINRTDLIAPMFQMPGMESFAFINAAAQPVQRVVEIVMRMVAENRKIVLMGMLPRVIKTYQRIVSHSGFDKKKISGIGVIAGERRLQFVTQSYPYEADFRKPFHVIIRDFRDANRIHEPCCFMPFEQFMSLYAPTAHAEERVKKLEKASDVEELRGSDRVQSEAERYLKWESSKTRATFDDKGNERFRRIVLSGFTNRDVLLFYYESITADTPFRNALREVIGALRENPNYLSDRAVYYNVQELVRSLGQIHFSAGTAPDAGLKLIKPSRGRVPKLREGRSALLNGIKPAFQFVKHRLVSAVQIAIELGRMAELTAGRSLMDESAWDRVVCAILLSGSVLEDAALADCILSPEDISSNRAVRRMMGQIDIPLASMIDRNPAARSLLSEEERRSVARLFEDTRLEPGDTLPYLLTQSGLLLSFYCDFSKVENWKRGKIHIDREDLEPMWTTGMAEFRAAGIDFSRTEAAAFEKGAADFCRTTGPDLLNEIAGRTHSYVRLFNALSLAAELRYGLSPRGFDLFHNVRTIYGSTTADAVGEAVIGAKFPLRERVKFARKLRMFAAALTDEADQPDRLMLLPAAHPLTAPPLDEIRGMLRGSGGSTALIAPAGDYNRVIRILRDAKKEFGAEEAARFSERTKFLVGEEDVLLVKDMALRHTGVLRGQLAAWRRREGRSKRYIFVPARDLIDDANAADAPRPGPRRVSRGLLFFRAWVNLFE